MRRLVILVAICLAPTVSAGQTVVWTTAGPESRAAVAVGGLMDAVLAEQERLRTTVMTHRKLGLRPSPGEEVLARPGEVVVARVTYTASYFARPRADFVNGSGIPIRAEGFRVWRMLNNKFCGLSGKKCYDDKNHDGTWDSAGRDKGRWVDVPYEVVELRKEDALGDRWELMRRPDGLGVELRVWIRGTLATSEPCQPSEPGRFACGGLAIRELAKPGEGLLFLVEKGT